MLYFRQFAYSRLHIQCIKNDNVLPEAKYNNNNNICLKSNGSIDYIRYRLQPIINTPLNDNDNDNDNDNEYYFI